MNIPLLLFIIGLLFIIAGYVNSVVDNCSEGTQIKIVPRNVYDQIIKDSVL